MPRLNWSYATIHTYMSTTACLFYKCALMSWAYSFARFGSDDLHMLCKVLQSAVSVPVHGEASPFILPSMTDPVLTPLQEGILLCMDTLQRVVLYLYTSKLNKLTVYFGCTGIRFRQ